MVDIVGIGVILGGVVLLLAGAALSLYGVALLGAVVGGAIGSFLGPVAGDAIGIGGTIALALGIIVGALAGILIAYAFMRWAVAMLGLIVGTYVGALVIAPSIADVSWLVEGAIGLGIGIAAAALATIFMKTLLVIITSVVGATLVLQRLTLDDLEAAADSFSLDPLAVDLADPLFLGLVAIGLLAQFGLLRLGLLSRLVPGADSSSS